MAPSLHSARRRQYGARLALGMLVVGSILWTGWSVEEGRELRSAPVVLVGPDVVTGPIAEQVEDTRGSALAVATSTDIGEGRARLREGTAFAVLELDLSGTIDRLLLPANVSDRREQRVADEIRSAAAGYGRSVHVEHMTGARPGWLEQTLAAPVIAFVVVAAGLLAATVMSILGGPVAPTAAAGLRRVLLLLVLSFLMAVGLAMAGVAESSSWLLGLACVGAGTLALACEAIGGMKALVVAAVLLGALPLPLVVAGDRWLLGDPWVSVVDWTLVGAATELLTRAPEAGLALRPLVVVVGASVLAVAVLLGSRLGMRNIASGPHRASPSQRPDETRSVLRLRMRLAAFAVGSVVFAVASYAGWTVAAHDKPVVAAPSLASATTCLQTGEIDDVADLNRIAQLRGSPAMRGGDVGASARLQDGRRLWMFGDTIRNGDSRGVGFVRNSMLLVVPGCLEVVLPESGGAIIPERDDGVGYWPMSVLVSSRPGYDLVAVTAQRVRTVDGSDVFGFENVGPAVATFVVPVGKTPQLISRIDLGPDSSDTERPMWGAATVVRGGMAYLYGTARSQRGELGSGFSLSVARAPLDEIDDQTKWRYWTGTFWGKEPAAAAKLIDRRGGVSQTLSVFVRDGRWYALSKRNDFLGQDLVIWTAPGPTGPFLPHEPVAALPSDAASGTLRYMPLAHPGLLPRRGTVVVSYSQNRTDVTEVLEDPRRYRPRFLRVTLPAP